ncbi:kinase-like domain-containing protein [Phaeosphaeriaceae sp. PMI808]|nr:kinase-like domain-containing protein [Phaeosphaeriaceae sp. PMI808]
MARPSEDWSGFAGLSPESDKYKQIKLILSSANFKHLKKCAIDSRRRHQMDLPPDTDCSINLTQFATGFNNLVFELAFSDDIYWIARIPYRTTNDTKTSLLSEIATMNIVRQRTSIPIPRIFEFEMSVDEPFGYPYVLMEYLGGRKLDDGLAKSIPQQYHTKVAKQLANVFAELQNLTFSRIGRLWCGETADQPVEIIPMAWHHSPGPLETSLEYFYNQRQGENREIVALHPNNADWLTACWVLKTALAHTVIEDRVRGPFPLCHLDLHFGNLLFDDEYNLAGVIDWSNAQAAPIEQLSVCPELVIFPGLSEEKNRPIVEFKKFVIQFVKEIENEKAKEEGKGEGETPPLNQQQGNMKQSQHLTPLSTYMASESAELMHRQYMASPKGSLWAAKRAAKLIYGEHITWEQLRKVYGCMPLL